ncbi:hypothetical protein ACP2AV_06300 [Aliiroseovarius sp. PTFE2010]|uniref:hypothetical protein n=1 Tax=Aliiroseovarius sp. PTFE2010 TaxID=3417190 RepID=UPI003CE9E06C
MLLRLIAVFALLGSLGGVFMAFNSGQPQAFGPAIIQGIVAFAVLWALANIVDFLEVIAENSEKTADSSSHSANT